MLGNSIKYRVDKPIAEIMDILTKVFLCGIELNNRKSTHWTTKSELNKPNTPKHRIVILHCKRNNSTPILCGSLIIRGNLSQKSLSGVVKREHVVLDSEYLETIFIAIPRFFPPG